jgi:L-methionine (R)-S-oxide reductase
MDPVKLSKYKELYQQIEAVITDTDDIIACMASVSCLIKNIFPDLLWVGFYRLLGDDLIVGPYQGSLGCTYIPSGKGVCGKAAETRKTVVVPDVHKFAGHIACDSRSKSEIVVPVLDIYGNLMAVLDIDSKEQSYFDEADKVHLEKIVKLLADKKILV